MARRPRRPFALTWVLLAVVTGAMGLIFPATMTLAQEAGDRARGTASSLQGGLSMAAGAVATPMTGVFGDTSVLPMAALMTAGLAAGAVALLLSRRIGKPARATTGGCAAPGPVRGKMFRCG